MKRYIRSSVDWSYYDKPKFQKMEQRYLPRSGEGETMAEQAMVASTKLVYRWYNDGDVYDNTYFMAGEPYGNDLSDYANWLYRYVPDTQDALYSILTDCDNDDDYEDILKQVTDAVNDEETLSYLETKEKKGSVYSCSGPFKCIDYEEEEEDW